MSIGRTQGAGLSWDGLQRPVRSMDDARRKIDTYDKTLPRHWAESTLPWIARSVAGEIGHQYYHWPENNALYGSIPKRLANFTDTQISYYDLFNIDQNKIYKPSDVTWKEFLEDKEVQDLYKQTVRENFENFKFHTIRPTKYLKHVVGQYNVARFIDEIQRGKILPALSRGLGIGFFA
jgi:hypothetical protein